MLPESARRGVEQTLREARAALEPARPKQYMQIFAELEVTHPRRSMSKVEHRVFSEKLKKDTEGLSAWALQTACDRYRQNPDNRFFPSGAELRKLVERDITEWQGVVGYCQKILNYKPPRQSQSPGDQYMTPERLAEIQAEMGK